MANRTRAEGGGYNQHDIITLYDMIGLELQTYDDFIILRSTMVSVTSILILHVSHAVEVFVFMFVGVRCHTSVVFLIQ